LAGHVCPFRAERSGQLDSFAAETESPSFEERGNTPLVAQREPHRFPFPGWLWHLGGLHQVAGRSTGQNPNATLDAKFFKAPVNLSEAYVIIRRRQQQVNEPAKFFL